MGYHIGSVHDPDFPVYEAIADILGQGRTSRLYKKLVKQEKVAVQAASFAGFPDDKYPCLLGVFGVPVKGVTALELEDMIFAEIDRLKTEGATAEELAGVKTRAKANFIRSLRGNRGLARQLSYYQGKLGDWRELFKQVDEIEAVTLDDIQRVANKIFDPNNRTVVWIETIDES